MKCPRNTVACKVKKIKSSKEKFGSPPGPIRVLYECELCGYFVVYFDRNALSGFASEPIDID
jgi:hypothetical protein